MPTPDPASSYLLQESGSGYFLLEDSSGFILLEQQSPTPPTPTIPPGGGGHHRRRKTVRLNNGRVYEIENDADLRLIVEQIIEDRQAEQQPQKKAKISRKIRQRVKKQDNLVAISSLENWDMVYQRLSDIQMSVITENILLDLLRNMVLAEMQDEEDTEILLWLM